MPIDNFKMSAAEGWVPFTADADTDLWIEGGPLSAAPVDADATFADQLWLQSRIDPTFHLQGVRYAAGFVTPGRRHSLAQMVMVLHGSAEVTHDGGEPRQVRAGQFWTTEAGSEVSVAAGEDGVIVVETWEAAEARPTTTWSDSAAWKR